MAQVINTNVASLNAQRNLGTSNAQLATSLQRLSSGLRINSAKDDAAGLAISERFTTQIRGLDVAARNANDGISLAQTAEGSLGEVSNNLQRIRELAVQSRNATNSVSDRQALDAEVQQLKSEIGRVAAQTSFNGIKLLDGSFTAQAFQVGANQGQTIDIASIANAAVASLGSWTNVTIPASVTGTAPDGGATAATATDSVASGAFTTATSGAAGENFTLTVGGVEILNQTSIAAAEDITAADLDTALTAATAALTTAGITVASGSFATNDIVFSQADGSDLAIALTSDFATAGGSFAGVGFVGSHTGGTAATAASFTALAGNALTINGTNIEVGVAADAATRAADLMAAINSANIGVTASISSGALQLSSASSIVIAGSGANAAQSGLSAATTTTTTGASMTGFSAETVLTADAADSMILAMDAALDSVNASRADLGAVQNRFSSVINSLAATSENLTASRSRIRDTDFAKETAELSRNQILQQAGTAMLAQANQLPQNVLSLLR